MKKKIILVLVFTLLILSLMGCSTSNKGGTVSDQSIPEDIEDTPSTDVVSDDEIKPIRENEVVSPDDFVETDFSLASDFEPDEDFRYEDAIKNIVCRTKAMDYYMLYHVSNNNDFAVSMSFGVDFFSESGERLEHEYFEIEYLGANSSGVFFVDSPYAYRDGKITFTTEIDFLSVADEDNLAAVNFIKIDSEKDGNGVDITTTNNYKGTIRRIEYLVLFYKGDTLIDATYDNVYALDVGESDTNFSSYSEGEDFDSWKILVNYAG